MSTTEKTPMAKMRSGYSSQVSGDSESETNLDSMAESSPETKSSRPGGPFNFETMMSFLGLA